MLELGFLVYKILLAAPVVLVLGIFLISARNRRCAGGGEGVDAVDTGRCFSLVGIVDDGGFALDVLFVDTGHVGAEVYVGAGAVCRGGLLGVRVEEDLGGGGNPLIRRGGDGCGANVVVGQKKLRVELLRPMVAIWTASGVFLRGRVGGSERHKGV